MESKLKKKWDIFNAEHNKQLMFTLLFFILPENVPNDEDLKVIENIQPELNEKKLEELTKWHSSTINKPPEEIKKKFENLFTLVEKKLKEYSHGKKIRVNNNNETRRESNKQLN